MFLISQQLTEVIKKKNKKCMDTNDNENMTTQNAYSESSSKREVYSNTILPQEIRKISNIEPNFYT